MEWHAHAFIGKALLDKGRTVLLGGGTKLRNFVAARDVASVIARLVTAEAPVDRIVEVVGPHDFCNREVAQMYARAAGIPARTSFVPRSVVAVLAAVARPLHPGIARAMRIASLPDDAFPETADAGDANIARVAGPTTMAAFIAEQVLAHGAAR
jgi:nucleoside-diphosphate-sugar epimerase